VLALLRALRCDIRSDLYHLLYLPVWTAGLASLWPYYGGGGVRANTTTWINLKKTAHGKVGETRRDETVTEKGGCSFFWGRRGEGGPKWQVPRAGKCNCVVDVVVVAMGNGANGDFPILSILYCGCGALPPPSLPPRSCPLFFFFSRTAGIHAPTRAETYTYTHISGERAFSVSKR